MNIEHSISNFEVLVISTSWRNLKNSMTSKRSLDVSHPFDMTKLRFFKKEVEAQIVNKPRQPLISIHSNRGEALWLRKGNLTKSLPLLGEETKPACQSTSTADRERVNDS